MSGLPADRPEAWEVRSREVLGRGRVCNFVEDAVVPPHGDPFRRQYISHPGAVGIIATDDQDRVAVVHQYRHPVGLSLVEPPAGLLDVAGEDYLLAAQRELAEEVQLQASTWKVLVDVCTSPGGSQESARVFWATGLSPAPHPEGFTPEDEEAHMQRGWVDFEVLVDQILAGALQSPLLVAGVMALAAARGTGRLDTLREPGAPWPVRDIHDRYQLDA